jgi:carbon-monoxide dehydrogenase medium subunit
VPAEKFCVAPGKTVLGPGDLLVQLKLPAPERRSGAHYLRFIPRNEMDIAVAGVGASVTLNGGARRVKSARVALSAVGPTPIFAEEAGAYLAGKDATEENIAHAAKLAGDAARPIDDMRGTIAQRRHLVEVLTRRVLECAISRAKENE